MTSSKQAGNSAGTHPVTGSCQCLRVADLSAVSPNPFDLPPADEVLARLAQDVAASSISRFRFCGDITARSGSEWWLSGRIGASVVQQCVISLQDVRTRIDVTVERRFLADIGQVYPGIECPVPEDDTIEVLTREIDLYSIAREVLLLELPVYPRKAGAGLPDGTVPQSDDLAPEGAPTERPFAILSDFRDRLVR